MPSHFPLTLQTERDHRAPLQLPLADESEYHCGIFNASLDAADVFRTQPHPFGELILRQSIPLHAIAGRGIAKTPSVRYGYV
jgi:hypothetical protein